ncbi:MAG: sulfatase-like hydrolase/transferase [Planctomycetota bacterium]
MPDPLNILFICTDQQRFDAIGCNGAPHARTPNVDRLARDGLNFQNHFATNPVCSPARASMMTGLHTTEHGLWANGCDLPTHHTTIPQALQQGAGYQTAHFGKLHLESIIRRIRPHDPYGFETCSVSEGDQQLIDDDYFRWLRSEHPNAFVEALAQMYEQGHSSAYTNCLPEPLTMSAFVTRQACNWLESSRDDSKPFYLSVGYFDPHHAFNPCEPYASDFAETDCGEPFFDAESIDGRPQHYREAFAGIQGVTRDASRIAAIRRSYHAMAAHVDDCVGRILRSLEQAGLSENTLVVFSSDHGEMLGEHGLLWKGPWLLDDLLKVPLVMNIPGAPLGGRSVEGLTSAVDLFATFQAVAGIGSDKAVPSSGRPFFDADRSLFPVGERDFCLAEWEHPSDQASSSLRCIRTATHKLVHYNRGDAGEFYCLVDDPREARNRFGDPDVADAQRDLTQKLQQHYLAYRPHQRHLGAW